PGGTCRPRERRRPSPGFRETSPAPSGLATRRPTSTATRDGQEQAWRRSAKDRGCRRQRGRGWKLALSIGGLSAHPVMQGPIPQSSRPVHGMAGRPVRQLVAVIAGLVALAAAGAEPPRKPLSEAAFHRAIAEPLTARFDDIELGSLLKALGDE